MLIGNYNTFLGGVSLKSLFWRTLLKDLFIRGDVDDSVVICTNDTTYDVKLCQTSNQLLVIPDSITPKQGIFH